MTGGAFAQDAPEEPAAVVAADDADDAPEAVSAAAVADPCAELAASCAETSRDDDGLAEYVDGVVAALMATLDVQGAVVAVVHGGEVAFLEGYGHADAARTTPVDPEATLFRPGSISKTFTWSLVVQLAAEGKLDLDADVNDYLTEFSIPEAFGAPITLRHILAHTAGLEDRAFGLFAREPAESLAGNLAASMPKRVRAPGEAAAYSNWASALAGLVVANVEGKSFEDVVDERIFRPAGMTRATFREPLPDDLAPLMAETAKREKGQYADLGFEFIGGYGPAGALTASGADMARYMLMHLGDGTVDGRQVLSRGVTETLRQPLYRPHPGLPAMLHGFYESDVNGAFGYGHGGATLGFFSNMVMVPEEDFGVFVSFAGPEGREASVNVTASLADWLRPQPDFPRPEEVAAAEDLEPVLGSYRALRMNFSTVEKVLSFGELKVTSHEDGGILLPYPSGPQRYVSVPGEERLFMSVDDPALRIGFSGEGTEPAEYLYIDMPAIAFRRIAPRHTSQVHAGVLGVGAAVALGVLFGGLWGTPKWLAMDGSEKLARIFLFFGAAGLLAGVVGLAASLAMAGMDVVFDGLALAELWLTLSLAGAALTGLAAVMVVPAWARGSWSLLGRIRYTLTVLVLLAMVWSMAYWNMIGPWNA